MLDLVVDDLARQSRFQFGREGRRVTNLCRERGTRRGCGPRLLFDDLRAIRWLLMRRFGLGNVVETGVFAATPAAVATRTLGDETKRVADTTVTATDAAELGIL